MLRERNVVELELEDGRKRRSFNKNDEARREGRWERGLILREVVPSYEKRREREREEGEERGREAWVARSFFLFPV